MQASLVAQWENLSAMQVDCKRYRFGPWVGKIPWRRSWQPSPVFLPGEFHGQRSLVGYSLWGFKELDVTLWLTYTGCIFYLFPRWFSSKESVCQELQGTWVWSLGQKDPLEKKWQPTPVFLAGESHEQTSLAGYSPWGCKRVRHGLVTEHAQFVTYYNLKIITDLAT